MSLISRGVLAAVVSLIWEVLLLYRDVSDLGGVVAAAVSLIWEVLLLQRCL